MITIGQKIPDFSLEAFHEEEIKKWIRTGHTEAWRRNKGKISL